MLKGKKKTCVVCGAEYDYCNHCKSQSHLPTWMSLYDNENCRTIMNICTEFMAGNVSKADAKKVLDACDLKNKNSFSASVLNAVNLIYAPSKTAKADAKTEAKVEKKTEMAEKNVVND